MTYSGQPFLPDVVLPSSTRKSLKVDPDGYKIVSVRLREAEFEAFSQQARALGLTNNMALRVAARRIGGFLEIDADTRALLVEIVGEIGTISRNIAELNITSTQRGQVNLQEFSALRAAFGQEFARLDASLRSILNTSRSRTDGRLLLKDALNP